MPNILNYNGALTGNPSALYPLDWATPYSYGSGARLHGGNTEDFFQSDPLSGEFFHSPASGVPISLSDPLSPYGTPSLTDWGPMVSGNVFPSGRPASDIPADMDIPADALMDF